MDKGGARCSKVRMRTGRLTGADCHVKKQQEVNYRKSKNSISFHVKMII